MVCVSTRAGHGWKNDLRVPEKNIGGGIDRRFHGRKRRRERRKATSTAPSQASEVRHLYYHIRLSDTLLGRRGTSTKHLKN
jgi:hypothetical protein